MNTAHLMFLEKVKFISEKYKENKLSNRFNIFTTMFNGGEEVTLHSKFLYELLRNTENSEVYLKLFLENLEESIELNDYEIYREYRNIDLLIRTKEKAIIIENKIYADDQPKQLYRYYEIMKEEGIKPENISCYYLTLDGKKPSNDSLNGLEVGKDVQLISYAFDINNWLEQCIKESVYIPSLREIIIQYKKLIFELTGQNEEGKSVMEIKKEIMKSKENFEAALDIIDAVTETKIEIQYSIWEELEAKLSEKGYFKDGSHTLNYDREKVKSYYSSGKGGYGFYSRLLPLVEGLECHLTIEIDSNIYWGITINKNGKNASKAENIGVLDTKFKEALSENGLSRYNTEASQWLSYVKFNRSIRKSDSLNFKRFSSDDLISCVEKSYRENLVDELVNEINTGIKAFLVKFDTYKWL